MMLNPENQLLQSFQNPQQVSFGTFRKEKEKKNHTQVHRLDR